RASPAGPPASGRSAVRWRPVGSAPGFIPVGPAQHLVHDPRLLVPSDIGVDGVSRCHAPAPRLSEPVGTSGIVGPGVAPAHVTHADPGATRGPGARPVGMGARTDPGPGRRGGDHPGSGAVGMPGTGRHPSSGVASFTPHRSYVTTVNAVYAAPA